MLRRLALLFSSIVLAGGLAAGGAVLEMRELERGLPGEGQVARGVKVRGEAIPEGQQADAFVQRQADQILDRVITVKYGTARLGSFTLRELGAQADVQFTLTRLRPIGHRGGLVERARQARDAHEGRYDVPLPVQLDAVALAQRLVPLKEELDLAAQPARRRIDRESAKDEISRHEDGAYLDVYAATDALLEAALDGESEVDLEPFRWVPAATSEAVTGADVSTVVSSFETRFGGPPGRDRNIARAAKQLHGLVLMPGEVVSFNETVGPRTAENGFYSAPEIYKGEMREGIGGGSCQVASTLYAAAYFGGFDIVERQNHSRPSGYIRPGMDATVSFPVLDLRVKNPFDFPVVLSARAEKGMMRFELLGKEKRVDVALATQTAGILKYSRKLEKAHYLPEGEFRVKQKGKRGLAIKKLKTVKDLKTGEAKLEESRDVYPLEPPAADPAAAPPT